MSHFIELIRSGKLKGPQQPKFDLEAWNREYAKLSAPTECDKSVHAAGIWVHEELTRIRDTTKNLGQYLTTPDPKRLFVGLAIREWLVLSRKVNEQLQRKGAEGIFLEELAHGVIKTVFGTEVTPEGVIETTVDAIRFPLSTFKTPAHGTSAEPGQVLEAALKLFLIAQLYHILEQLWLEIIWNDYLFEEAAEKILIKPSDSPLHQIEAVSHFRRQLRQSEAVTLARTYWTHELPDPVRRRLLLERKLFTVIKKPSGKIRIKVSDASRHLENPDAAPIQHLFLTHTYTDGYIQSTVPEFHNLTVKQVILAFDLVSQIPRQMIDLLPRIADVRTPETAMSFAPEFEREELQHGFEKALNISAEQAEFLVAMMTHTGSVRDQLWFKPIVDFGDGKISILLPAVNGIHYFRLVDHLLKEIPNAESKIGRFFEEYVRGRLANAAELYRFAPDLRVYSRKLEFRIQAEFEEIDLAFALGNRIFVGECKASLYPAEPLEVHNYVSKLTQEAVPQAERKAAFVRAHLPEFLTSVDFPIDPKAAEVFSLVVTNGNLYSGYPISEVPITDVLILTRYFESGTLELLVRTADSGERLATEVEHFYTSRSEALGNFQRYLLFPPQVRVFERAVALEERPLPRAAGAKQAAFREFVVRPDYESLKATLKAAENVT